MSSETRPKVPKRRFYSSEFKLQVVGECGQAGASIAAVALKHGVNANIVHRWLREHSQGALAVRSLAFVPVTLPAQPPPAAPQPELATLPDIQVELQRANTRVVVKWPLQDSKTCAAWLREWLA